MTTEYKQHTSVVSLDEILWAWGKEFTMQDGSEIIGIDHYVDPVKNKAVFVISTKKEV